MHTRICQQNIITCSYFHCVSECISLYMYLFQRSYLKNSINTLVVVDLDNKRKIQNKVEVVYFTARKQEE